MDDLIDRQALISVFAGLVPYAIDGFEDAAYARGLDAGYRALVEAPAVDAVEVVRCKDCESYNNHFSQPGFGWCEEEALRIVNDNFYCGNAKRRANNG